MAEQSKPYQADMVWKTAFRVGGISVLAYIGLVLIGSFLFNTAQAPTSVDTGEAMLKFIAAQKTVFSVSNVLFHFGLVFFIPMILALFLVLKNVSRTFMLLATALALIGVSAFLTWIFALNVALIRLSDLYAAASTDAQRAAYVAAAELDLGTQSGGEILGTILIGVWIPIVSVVMLRSKFDKTLAILGIATSILTPIGFTLATVTGGAPVFAAIGFGALLLMLIWFLLVGIKLYRLGGQG